MSISAAVVKPRHALENRADRYRKESDEARLTGLWATYWAERDRVARNELILAYESIVHVVLARLPSTLRAHWETDDLRSFGLLGLMEAVDRFDPGSLVGRFPSYAMARVRGAIFDELRRLDWLPRTVRRRVISYRATVDELSSELGRVPQTAEVLQQMGVSGGEASGLLQAVQSSQLEHLQQETDSDSGRDAPTLFDLIAADRDAEPEAQVLFEERLSEMRAAIAALPERQRTVISLHFFGGLTQDQIGAMLGVTNSRICQIEAEAMQTLRRMLDGPATRPVTASRAG